MSKNLVLVESPAKAKTINKYLGKNFVVEATVGHVRDLPKSTLGVDIQNGFKPQLNNIRGKATTIKKIKSLAAKSSKIYIATDPDREGEAIAQDIAELLEVTEGENVFRVLFNEITKTGVVKGMNEPRRIDLQLVASQRARRVMDRILGYEMSPVLWRAIIDEATNNLSAGRVQSVALRLICEREAEIRKFKSVEYWSIWGIFETAGKELFRAKLAVIDGKTLKTPPKADMSEEEWQQFNTKFTAIKTRKEADDLFAKIRAEKQFVISDIVKKKMRRNAPAPFITSTLQAEASKALRFRPRYTMQLAQKLYEGIELGKEGSVGLITYMRTDSTRISPEAITEVREYIQSTFGNEYLPASPNLYEKKGSGKVQDAHEAIRPTSVLNTPEKVRPYLEDNSFKLYQLIYQRFVASQMSPAQLETTVIEISAGEFLFKAYGQSLLFPGYLKLYHEEEELKTGDDDKEEGKNEKIPLGLEKGDKLRLDELKETQHFTQPPPRFTESTLIKELEQKGIGRPSTYSSIIGTITERNYVLIEERKLVPTALGERVNNTLTESFPDIVNVNFTYSMEQELDQIAQGENDYLTVMNDFYGPFSTSLKKVNDSIEKIICDKCGGEMSIKLGRFGKFLACNNYPECKNIKSLKQFASQNQEPEFTGETCPKCSNRLLVRQGRFGKFTGCEKYPDCDYIKPNTIGVSCPKCSEGDVISRQTKKRKVFYGCSRYPDCDFVAWNKPVDLKCTKCASKYLEEKFTKKNGKHLVCPSCSNITHLEGEGDEREAV